MRGLLPALAVLAATATVALSGCGVAPGTLVSAQSPAGTGAVNAQSEPQPIGSLPPGAATSGTGPGQSQPSFLQTNFRL